MFSVATHGLLVSAAGMRRRGCGQGKRQQAGMEQGHGKAPVGILAGCRNSLAPMP